MNKKSYFISEIPNDITSFTDIASRVITVWLLDDQRAFSNRMGMFLTLRSFWERFYNNWNTQTVDLQRRRRVQEQKEGEDEDENDDDDEDEDDVEERRNFHRIIFYVDRHILDGGLTVCVTS